ncbi:MAG: restriction endonuclease [Candidatus Levybacteria bacterium]|nr:restriction endonuclease [Candidatus Levybacteria bacterium]
MPYVLKATGQKELFSEEKLRLSIQRSGLPANLTEGVVNHIKPKLYEGIPTAEIYRHITEFLGNSSNPFNRSLYSLKQAIMELGPTGYPFEDYISEILKMEGYATTVRQVLQGTCVSHEVDVVAQKQNKYMIECKFHNNPGGRCQIHVSLYTKARFDDIKEKHNFNEAWLVTNTKITPDALNYAICSRMKVISWDYPAQGSFRDLVEKYKLYPITVLSSISQAQKQLLTTNHIVLTRDLYKNPSSLDVLGLPNGKSSSILAECQFLNA